jgi:hypothetical protein
MTAPLYANPWQAAADMARLTPAPPQLLQMEETLRTIVGHPQARSDHLLLIADALRIQARAFTHSIPSYAAQLTNWANTLTDLAPTRANPIEAA